MLFSFLIYSSLVFIVSSYFWHSVHVHSLQRASSTWEMELIDEIDGWYKPVPIVHCANPITASECVATVSSEFWHFIWVRWMSVEVTKMSLAVFSKIDAVENIEIARYVN